MNLLQISKITLFFVLTSSSYLHATEDLSDKSVKKNMKQLHKAVDSVVQTLSGLKFAEEGDCMIEEREPSESDDPDEDYVCKTKKPEKKKLKSKHKKRPHARVRTANKFGS